MTTQEKIELELLVCYISRSDNLNYIKELKGRYFEITKKHYDKV